MKWYQSALEMSCVAFAWYAFGWQAGAMVFLMMWERNVYGRMVRGN